MRTLSFALLLLICLVVATTLTNALIRVRSRITHTNIPKDMLWETIGGAKAPWRVWELQGRYVTWMSDTGAFNTGQAFACGLEKLQIDQSSGKFVAIHDYDVTIVDYFTIVAEDALSKTDIEQVYKDCLVQFQKKEDFVTSSGFDLVIDSVDVSFDTVDDDCSNKQNEKCAISSIGAGCNNTDQCGGKLIECRNDICSGAVEYSLLVVFAVIAIVLMF